MAINRCKKNDTLHFPPKYIDIKCIIYYMCVKLFYNFYIAVEFSRRDCHVILFKSILVIQGNLQNRIHKNKKINI